MNTSKATLVLASLIVASTVASAMLPDHCDPGQLAGKYQLAGEPAIVIYLDTGGKGRLSIGSDSADFSWDHDAKSGNVFLDLPPGLAQKLRERARAEPIRNGSWRRVQFGLDASCPLNGKRLYLNRDANIYLSYVGPPR